MSRFTNRFPLRWSDARDLNEAFDEIWPKSDWTTLTLWPRITEVWIGAKQEDVDPREWRRHLAMAKTLLFCRMLRDHSYEDVMASVKAE